MPSFTWAPSLVTGLYIHFRPVSKLSLYMSIMVSNCSGERSFSKMALIKNKLRSTMSDRQLSALQLLSVENKNSVYTFKLSTYLIVRHSKGQTCSLLLLWPFDFCMRLVSCWRLNKPRSCLAGGICVVPVTLSSKSNEFELKFKLGFTLPTDYALCSVLMFMSLSLLIDSLILLILS